MAREIRTSGFGVLCFLVGATECYKFNLLGEIYLVELLLPVLALLSLGIRRTGAAPGRTDAFLMFGMLLVTFSGYVLTDLVRGAPPDQFLRGWGRVILVFTDLLSVYTIARRDKRYLWWLVLGMGVGGTLWLRVMEHMPISNWKFGYSRPLTIFATACAYFMPLRIAAAIFAFIAVMSMVWDFRIHSAVCMAIAAALWIRAADRPGHEIDARKYIKLGFAALFVAVAVIGLLKWTESDYYKQRRGSSSWGREVALKVGLQAISESPVIGYGSWGVSPDIQRIERALVAESPEGKIYPYIFTGSSMAAHSQLLQAWVEAGVLGAVFFIILGIRLVKYLPSLVLRRRQDYLTPILYYFVFMGVWNLINSPFSTPHRMNIALATLAVIIQSAEAQTGRRIGAGRAPLAPAPSVPRRIAPGGAWRRSTSISQDIGRSS